MGRLYGLQADTENRCLKIPLKLDLLFPLREGKRTGHPRRDVLLEVLRQVLEASELRKEGELHIAHGAAPVFPDDDLGDPLRLLRRLLLGVHLLAVDEQDQVAVLLDRPGIVAHDAVCKPRRRIAYRWRYFPIIFSNSSRERPHCFKIASNVPFASSSWRGTTVR